MDENLKTYNGWLSIGRAVKAGERANCYLVSPDREHSKALFHLDQTEVNREKDLIADWTTVVTRDERPVHAKRKKHKKIRVDYNTANQELAIWVGPDKELIKWLKQGGYSYVGATHRWVTQRPDWQTFVEKIAERRQDVRFVVTVDGHLMGEPLELGI